MKAFAKAAFLVAVCAGSQAMASDAEFLQSIEGQWSGGGTALTKLGGSNVKVSCSMRSDANVRNFSMDGTCACGGLPQLQCQGPIARNLI